ncbi:MAG TPA: hypothetical protein VHP13_01390 [Gammaproteobacteria bacterium]|jgi:photosystem II stability/assembly factor-like uncharacterized protein|nr:hypothetical protein [Gammaproteobacteria bacterium]
MSRLSAAILSLILVTTAMAAAPARAADADMGVLYSQLQWRQVGPFRGGWAIMAEGIAGQPNTFYFGGADGGVWKTVDAGLTWKPQFQNAPSISIGALAVAPSQPDTIYIGTGQPETRYDIVDGAGVYRSDDGGETWRSLGLTDTRHIGRIWVDPRNPDVVVVAALGHMFGPNEERGVFRSTDGGKHWDKVLFVDQDTGAVDLAVDSAKPDVMFAATWQVRDWPWLSYFMPEQGPGSGIWKSLDGGKTWTRIAGHGLPEGSLGRIGLAVAPGSGAQRVYALVEAADDDKTGLYRSDDGGTSWKLYGSHDLVSSYFNRITVDPHDPDTLYVMNRSVARSTDGGKTFKWFKGAPGGDDYHFMWINPAVPGHLALASDQGATISVDGGKTWSQWYNQPTGQFYHVATDDRFPYHIYSGQQDSGTVETESSSDFGEISFRDWNPVGGDERSYVIPDNADPNIVYVGGLGGHVSRFDKRTGQVQNISATPLAGYAQRPTTVKYRYGWFYPLVADPHRAHTLYLGAQFVLKTTDGGMHWTPISPDLTGPDPEHAAACDSDNMTFQQAKDCGFGVVFSIAPSPVKDGVIWAGTDDGLVHLTRDGGKHWQDVTPDGMPFYGRVNQVEASPHDPATAYVAVDIHRQDKFQPYVFRTHDYGKTWESITDGIPASQFVYVVRQDLKDPKLLYAGTNVGVYVSFDDGGHWRPLQANLPNARVRDITLHGDDLIAATHGRAIWVLDDVAPLRHLDAAISQRDLHLFAPAQAVRVRRNENKDTPLPPEVAAGENPPEGAILDYWLGQGVSGPVTLEIRDAAGKLVRRYASDAKLTPLPADQYFNDAWLAAPERLAGGPGAHRFVWDLRYPHPPSLSYDYSIAAVFEKGGALLPQGPLVLPGKYTVTLSTGGRSVSQPLVVALDPRVSADEAKEALPKQLALAQQLDAALAASFSAHEEVAALRKAIAAARGGLDGDLLKAMDALDAKAEQLEEKAAHRKSLAAINAALASLAAEINDGDRAPPAQYVESYHHYRADLDEDLKAWQAMQARDLAELNASLKAAGRPELRP